MAEFRLRLGFCDCRGDGAYRIRSRHYSFDIANNYGHPYNGSAEENFGKILDRGMREYRDELCISTKAGYEMWDGPYGDKNGSRKYLTASLDQSLRRLKLDYVDIYYHHISIPTHRLKKLRLRLTMR